MPPVARPDGPHWFARRISSSAIIVPDEPKARVQSARKNGSGRRSKASWAAIWARRKRSRVMTPSLKN